jgi:hypothetical protein
MVKEKKYNEEAIMYKILVLSIAMAVFLIPSCQTDQLETVDLTREVLLDKIRGGWVGKAYGVSFGGPTEFRYQGKIIEGPLELDPKGLEWLPWQDDMYVNMALLKAVVDKGLDATAEDFAREFAYGGFLLWHANGQGRQNLLEGIPPDKSGHPLYNPHADDIDFQIECDFIGLFSPGLPQSALKICDRAGHLMNWGDGVYGGYFVTAMYAAAFIDNDVHVIVEKGLEALPKESGYAAIIRDLLNWYRESPDDWIPTWQKIEDKYNNDMCPWGVHRDFNIQARLNGSYIALGLLYGDGDLLKTVNISTRCGQDSDCNPANAGGIVGTMLGFDKLSDSIKTDMEPHMNTDFHFTPFSIESASKECLRLALENIEKNGGSVSEKDVRINVQSFKNNNPAEISFPALEPADRFVVTDKRIKWQGAWELQPKGDESMQRSMQKGDLMEVEFEGNVVYVQGDLRFDQGILEYFIDGKSMGSRDMYLPKKWERADQSTAVWLTGLEDGKHTLRVQVSGNKNDESEGIMVSLGKVVSYKGQVASLK